MNQLELEGRTLGEKHKYFNNLVDTISADESNNYAQTLNTDDPDITNLLKIEVACKTRDVQFIINVFTCDDMMYITRAINKSSWLIEEDQYAHIINPQYLEKELFPKMSSRAKVKLLLAIRLKLKDPVRVEKFFTFFEEDFQTAVKWLPRCSLEFIDNILKKHSDKLYATHMTRLCENSIELLKACGQFTQYDKREVFAKSKALLKYHTDKFLNVIEIANDYEMPLIGKKSTKYLMSKCPNRIITNFDRYYKRIHIPTFVKALEKEQIVPLLLKHYKVLKFRWWLEYDELLNFLKPLSQQERTKLIITLAIQNKETIKVHKDCNKALCCLRELSFSSDDKKYRWYEWCTSFETAFKDLKDLMKIKNSPADRISILNTLINCAKSIDANVCKLLEYYKEKYINETLPFKEQFVDKLIKLTNTYKYNEKTWDTFNYILSSMGAYIDSENVLLPICIEVIIIRRLIHNEEIPDIIKKKFSFSSLKQHINKLNKNDQEVIFNHLYNYVIESLDYQITNELDMTKVVDKIQNALSLLKDWGKELKYFPLIIKKIKEIVNLKISNLWSTDLSGIYNTIYKTSRKYIFDETFTLHPSDEACLNILKHNPSLLTDTKDKLETMIWGDSITMKGTFRKIRVYWYESIRPQLAQLCLDKLRQTKNQNSTLRAICILLPRVEALPIIKQHAPRVTKIVWSDDKEIEIMLRKNIAKNVYLIRPAIDVNTVLLYAKHDYLSFSVASLDSILYNMETSQSKDCLIKLLDSPVSLRKHVVRLIFVKLNIDDMKEVIIKVLKGTRNPSIKAIIFRQTYNILVKLNNIQAIENMWELMSICIDSLSSDENRIIYNTLCKVRPVPTHIKALFYEKSYLYLKSLPAKANCGTNLSDLIIEASYIFDQLNPTFVEDVLLDGIKNRIITEWNDLSYWYVKILVLQLLSAKNEVVQIQRYEKLLLPILNEAFSTWHRRGPNHLKSNIKQLLSQLTNELKLFKCVQKKCLVPVELFDCIKSQLTSNLQFEENYKLIKQWNFIVLYVEQLRKYINDNPDLHYNADSTYENKYDEEWIEIASDVASLFGTACLEYLQQDELLAQNPILFTIISNTLIDTFSALNFCDKEHYMFYKSLLSNINSSIMFHIVLSAASQYVWTFGPEDKVGRKELCKLLLTNTDFAVKIESSGFIDRYLDDE